MLLKEAKQILKENGYTLMEISDSKMFDMMWDESQLIHDFKSGKIKHLDKFQKNKAWNFIKRKISDIVYKKLKDLDILPNDMTKQDASEIAATFICKTDESILDFITHNPVTYFTPEILNNIVNYFDEIK